MMTSQWIDSVLMHDATRLDGLKITEIVNRIAELNRFAERYQILIKRPDDRAALPSSDEAMANYLKAFDDCMRVQRLIPKLRLRGEDLLTPLFEPREVIDTVRRDFPKSADPKVLLAIDTEMLRRFIENWQHAHRQNRIALADHEQLQTIIRSVYPDGLAEPEGEAVATTQAERAEIQRHCNEIDRILRLLEVKRTEKTNIRQYLDRCRVYLSEAASNPTDKACEILFSIPHLEASTRTISEEITELEKQLENITRELQTPKIARFMSQLRKTLQETVISTRHELKANEMILKTGFGKSLFAHHTVVFEASRVLGHSLHAEISALEGEIERRKHAVDSHTSASLNAATPPPRAPTSGRLAAVFRTLLGLGWDSKRDPDEDSEPEGDGAGEHAYEG